jgi:hypothetical protein
MFINALLAFDRPHESSTVEVPTVRALLVRQVCCRGFLACCALYGGCRIQLTSHTTHCQLLCTTLDASIYMPLRISIWDDRGPNFDDALIAEVTFEAIEIYQSVGHIKSETLPNGAVYVTESVMCVMSSTVRRTCCFLTTNSAIRSGYSLYAILEESIKGDALGTAQMHLRALDMKNVEPGLLGLGRTDPFFEISKKNADYAAGVVVWYDVRLLYRPFLRPPVVFSSSPHHGVLFELTGTACTGRSTSGTT